MTLVPGKPSKTVRVPDRHALDYSLRRKIAEECGGWISSGGPEGETATVWHGDTEYVFSGEGLIGFLGAVKDVHVDKLYAAVDLCDYIAQSAKTPPSVFVRDAIVGRAAALKTQIQGEA